MKEPVSGFRKIVYQLLNGNVVYQGNAVSVIDGFYPSSTNSHFIMISDATSQQINNKTAYLHTGTCTLQVVTRMEGSNSKKAADEIAEQVLELLFGDPFMNHFTTDADFGYGSLSLAGTNYQQEIDDQYYIVTKILTINFYTYQK